MDEIELDGKMVIPLPTPESEMDLIKVTTDKMGLYDYEISRMVADINEAHGETEKIDINVRQLATLLNCYLSILEPRKINDCPWRERMGF